MDEFITGRSGAAGVVSREEDSQSMLLRQDIENLSRNHLFMETQGDSVMLLMRAVH